MPDSDKIYYNCPRCRQRVWVYTWAPYLTGTPCWECKSLCVVSKSNRYLQWQHWLIVQYLISFSLSFFYVILCYTYQRLWSAGVIDFFLLSHIYISISTNKYDNFRGTACLSWAGEWSSHDLNISPKQLGSSFGYVLSTDVSISWKEQARAFSW